MSEPVVHQSQNLSQFCNQFCAQTFTCPLNCTALVVVVAESLPGEKVARELQGQERGRVVGVLGREEGVGDQSQADVGEAGDVYQCPLEQVAQPRLLPFRRPELDFGNCATKPNELLGELQSDQPVNAKVAS